ncbi:male accessory gland serine protease inhibitor-like [Lucilia cuprina]|uniref:male accessory gland serine protease inhibitor-like n=1 Tax=Lucilia cuprina TaxID=7375 RepID=UPI001F06A369|nr:male accessory gland serine protease inhibitor-like [Lucilia cuprina]XP_046809501.1 male accessory gland serine protease inhibitor-like [Lucilia cuprina]
MKLTLILSLLVIALVACTSACRGSPRSPSCIGERNTGRTCRGCRRSIMWWYDPRTNQCRLLPYLGSGGNNNRWCTRSICNQRCRR